MFDGPEDPLKAEATDGWTSQRNDDKLILELDMGNGQTDVWQWSLSLSEPLGYAIDLFDDGTDRVNDAGDVMFERNVDGEGNRAGPKYEWDGQIQELTREPGGLTILDPGFYLLNKTEFTGDAQNGLALYQQECAACHGVEGDGRGFDWNTGYSMIIPGFLNRFSRESFASVTLSSSHDGASHFEILSESERDDLIAMIRGFTGVPGYYLQQPTGSSADVKAVSSFPLAQLNTRRSNENGYKVLLTRALNTGHNPTISKYPLWMGFRSTSMY